MSCPEFVKNIVYCEDFDRWLLKTMLSTFQELDESNE